MDSVYETLLNRLLEEVKNEDIKKGINIALSAYMDSGYMNYNDMYNDELMSEDSRWISANIGRKRSISIWQEARCMNYREKKIF